VPFCKIEEESDNIKTDIREISCVDNRIGTLQDRFSINGADPPDYASSKLVNKVLILSGT
jgi:hypothetical protein